MRPDEPTDEQNAETIRALLSEKAGYEARGDQASADGVADQLRRLKGQRAADRAQTRPRRGGIER